MSSNMMNSGMVTAGAVIFATLVLVTFFRYVNERPDKIAGDYHCCDGKWEESYLNDCCAGLTHIPQQPVNTYSNLAYLAAGLYVQFYLGTGPAFVFGVAMTYLAIGSALYHALSTKWAGMLDVTGIFTVYTATVVYAIAAVSGASQAHLTPTIMFVAAGLVAFLLSRRAGRYMRAVIASSLGVTYVILIIHMWVTGEWSAKYHVGVSLALFILGYWSWGRDRKRSFPVRGWGHGVWHVLTAVASAIVFVAIDRATAGPEAGPGTSDPPPAVAASR